MASKGSQHFFKKNRPPRVQITYEDLDSGDKLVELPFIMGVMADLSGSSPGVEKAAVADRKFVDISLDDFDKPMAAIQPGVSMRVENKLGGEGADKLGVTLVFNKMEDFGPAAIARQVPALASLLEAREQLANLLKSLDGKVAAADQLKRIMSDPHLMASVKESLDARPAAPSDDKSGS